MCSPNSPRISEEGFSSEDQHEEVPHPKLVEAGLFWAPRMIQKIQNILNHLK